MQVLKRKWDRTFSDHSYGFRPGRSAHQAVAAAQKYIVAGYRWCVDLDLEKFFDRVSHDKLMAKMAARVSHKRLDADPHVRWCRRGGAARLPPVLIEGMYETHHLPIPHALQKNISNQYSSLL
jgi:hypothetical protein